MGTKIWPSLKCDSESELDSRTQTHYGVIKLAYQKLTPTTTTTTTGSQITPELARSGESYKSHYGTQMKKMAKQTNTPTTVCVW